MRLRPPAKGQVPGSGTSKQRPPALKPAQPRRSSGSGSSVRAQSASSQRPSPPTCVTATAAAAKNKNKGKAALICGTSSNSQASESVNDTSAPLDEDGNHVNISDDEEDEEEMNEAGKRKLTSKVWLEMKKLKVRGEWKARCNYCHKDLTTGPNSGTKHLAAHLKTCIQKMLKTKGGKTLSQSSLMMNAKEDGNVSVENYTFDQDYARSELANMLVLHEYPLSVVDHAGFRKFVHALQPLFKLHTRNTIRSDIVENYNKERKKAIDYMTMNQSRVAITTDMWMSDSQKKGYMAVTAHFVDESWKLRSIIMRFIYVPAPQTADVIFEELYDSLLQWNLDEKLMTVTVWTIVPPMTRQLNFLWRR